MDTAVSFFATYFALKSTVALIEALVWSAAIILIYRFLKMRKHLNDSSPVITSLKERVYDPYGIVKYLPSRSTLKSLSLPPSAYLLHTVTGAALAFSKEKIFRSTVGFQNFVFLTKHESVEEFLKSTVPKIKPLRKHLVDWFGNALFTSFGKKWKIRRKLLKPVFYKNVLEECVPTFDRQSEVLVDVLKRRLHEKWIDIEETIAFCSMDIIGEAILGVHLGTQRTEKSKIIEAMTSALQCLVQRFINPIFHIDVLFRISTVGRQFKRDTSYINTFALQVIQERKEAIERQEKGNGESSEKTNTRNNDLLGVLLDVHKKNPDFTMENVKEEVVQAIFAGHDTTTAAMTWAIYLIGLYPEIQSKIHEELDRIFEDDHDRSVTVSDLKEMKYLECVLKECQRLYPSVPVNMMQNLEDFQLCGYKIKKGSTILFIPYQLHRDPEVFPNPEKFDPERFRPENSVGRSPFAYIPFSAGPRTCIGRHFGMMEIKTVIANVLRNFSVKSMEPRDKIFPAPDLILRSARPLKVQFTRRHLCGDLLH